MARAREAPPHPGVVTTLAGNGDAALVDGAGTAASFNVPPEDHAGRNRCAHGELDGACDSMLLADHGLRGRRDGDGSPHADLQDDRRYELHVPGLTSGVTYDLVVSASNAVGRSPASITGTGTPD